MLNIPHPMPEEKLQRIVAIVGRPNVGKSALFNRIVRQRVAIVHEECGVTRDRITRRANWQGSVFELIDTGGLAMIDDAKAADTISAGVRKQVEAALADAAVIILVTDLTAGVTPLDQEVARLLHRTGRKVVVAANKADAERLDGAADDFKRLGFPVHPVSASHNRGIDALMAAVVPGLPPGTAATEREPLKVVVVGRPNVGKSSYINSLLGSERVIVSEIPGTTRDSIEVPFTIGQGEAASHYLLIDTAGMRKVGRVHQSVERFSLFRAEQSIERADVVVLVLDAEQGPTEQDKKIAAMIMENHKGCVLLVNKWDLAGKMPQQRYRDALLKALFFMSYMPVVFASAKSGFNIRKSVEAIDYVAAQVSTVLPTGVLNRVLHDAFQKVQPPIVKNHRLKLYYATQVGSKPIRLRLFVNDPKNVAQAYEIFLLNTLRGAFGLEGAPVVMTYRSSHKEK